MHPQQVHTGAEPRRGGYRALQELRERAPATHQPLGCLSALCQCLNAGDRNPGILSLAGLIFLLIINTSMNKGRLVSLTGVGIVLNG